MIASEIKKAANQLLLHYLGIHRIHALTILEVIQLYVFRKAIFHSLHSLSKGFKFSLENLSGYQEACISCASLLFYT